MTNQQRIDKLIKDLSRAFQPVLKQLRQDIEKAQAELSKFGMSKEKFDKYINKGE